MSKYIKPGDEFMRKALGEYDAFLRQSVPGTFSLSKATSGLLVSTEKAVLQFTASAYAKMQYLISSFDSEVAWHGVAKRIADDKSEFLISDILLYPQEVTGSTVNTDQREYEKWLYDLEDDVFNNLRFQGHSHVNMGTSPSPTDLDHQERLLAQVTDDMFYIFVIWNKKNDRSIFIYDKKRNLFFDKGDVEVEITNDDSGFFDLIFSEDVVKKKTYQYQTKTATSFSTGFATTTPASTPAKTTTTTQISVTGKQTTGSASSGTIQRADGYQGGTFSDGGSYPYTPQYPGYGWYGDYD